MRKNEKRWLWNTTLRLELQEFASLNQITQTCSKTLSYAHREVLAKQPYHYARWMIILERWLPTIFPTFPSMIPFWITVQGIPVHPWSEEAACSIGNDIGTYETAEITPLIIRMRVHVNERLPLIKTTIIEYPNGDEVTATLLYETLERHCSKCNRLDCEIIDCLEAKHEKKALLAFRNL
ncbi:PREDICTED: uncharacterized protein At4g02000-like [Brassica oleracea var. oleracea]|nr:PREDICTED: uncharacterized protein At4g02000-like [Brassica oleracea var. oleracea]